MRCPVCNSNSTYLLYAVGKRPLSVSALQSSAQDSVNLPMYDIDICVCELCWHVFNASFDETVDQYSGDGCTMYNAGEAWSHHVQRVADYVNLIPRGRVVEIGAGDGEFLELLDGPKLAYEPSDDYHKLCHKGIPAHRAYYTPGVEDVEQNDLIVMRHVLEHIHKPFEFLDDLATHCRMSGIDINLVVEVPCVNNALKEGRIEDWTFEHPNHFTLTSLRTLFMRTGLNVHRIVEMYNGEVILAHVSVYRGSGHLDLQQKFKQITKLKTKLPNNVVFWGGAGKSTMILHEYALESLDRVVDSDERKWGKYVPGLPLRIETPDIIGENDTVIITTNWREEDILADMRRRNLKPAKVYTIKNGELHESAFSSEDC